MSGDKKGKEDQKKQMDKLRKAVNEKPRVMPSKTVVAGPVAAAATPKKPKKNHRSFKARDERAKTRGRLPLYTGQYAQWMGNKWIGHMSTHERVSGPDEELKLVNVHTIFHTGDGMFRMMEELDIMFWEWFTKTATAEQKARLTFAPDPPVPAPWPSPSTPESTAPA